MMLDPHQLGLDVLSIKEVEVWDDGGADKFERDVVTSLGSRHNCVGGKGGYVACGSLDVRENKFISWHDLENPHGSGMIIEGHNDGTCGGNDSVDMRC